MKKVLVIAYYYPPLADVGVKRTLRFVQNMRDFGWDPHVLTCRNPDINYCIPGGEPPPADVPLTRAPAIGSTYKLVGKINGLLVRMGRFLPFLEPKTHLQEIFAIPDYTPGWLPSAYYLGNRILKRERADLIYASVKPLGGGLLARSLAKKYDIPFVIDARDPISCRVFEERAPRNFAERYTCNAERQLVGDCEYFICTSDTTLKNYQRIYPEARDKFRLIYNGYDGAATSGNELQEDSGKFRIIYLGSFYPAYLDPNPFFEALRRFIDGQDGASDRVVFWFLGDHGEWLEQVTRRYGLQHVVRHIGRVNHDRMMDYLRSADLFLLRNPFHTNIGAKLFDGLAVDIPILSTLTHGEIDSLIRRFARQYTILPDESVECMSEGMARHFRDFAEGRLPRLKPFNDSFISDFGGKRLTEKLCTIFEETVS
jgi:glycosyltransferase involved in cell wall biosynthesis